jgi:tetratricopeptide (TPR) repeat protein
MAFLSATLIVRDESAFIEPCLESLAGVVDEIVIVDTGSRDDTLERAKRFPVSLYHLPWSGDFSAARNHAIERATGDWILYIDADERLLAPDRSLLRRMLADDTKAAWRLRLHPRLNWTAYAELRLFRNDPRIRFRGVIHERVHADVNAVCRSDGRQIGLSELSLNHVGYEGAQTHKLGRNIPMLRDYLAREPTRVYCWWHLGEMLRLQGDIEGALRSWRNGIEVVRAQPPDMTSTSDSPPFVSLIVLQSERNEAVGELLREALALFPRHLILQWIAAKLAIEAGDEETARPILERLAAIDAESFFDPDIAYEKPLFSHLSREALALCHFRAGRFPDAARWYRAAAGAAPDPAACELKARLAEARCIRP